jgi:hypothetical protein
MCCGKQTLVELEPEKLARWQAGELVQNVWPEKTSDERELLITGTHPECWQEMFGSLEDSDG